MLVEQGVHAPLVGELAARTSSTSACGCVGMRREVAEAELAAWVAARPRARGGPRGAAATCGARGPGAPGAGPLRAAPRPAQRRPAARARGRGGPRTGARGPSSPWSAGPAVIISDEVVVERCRNTSGVVADTHPVSRRCPVGRTRRSCAECVAPASRSAHERSAVQRCCDDVLRLLLDPRQVLGAAEALGVDLVDVLGARRARGEPAALGDDLQPAQRRPVAGRLGEPLR